MANLRINGGYLLRGSITNQSAKNSALAILCACVMIKDKVILTDVPQIEEINRLVELLHSIGVRTRRVGKNKLEIDASKQISLDEMDKKATKAIRSSLMLLGAFASRVKQYKLYKSGGCRLGERTVRPHIYALEKFGVKISSKVRYYDVKNNPLKSAELTMYESGDTATNNAIMAAVLAKGKTIIKMASANYMVQDLCYFLCSAGAKIEGIGTTSLIITGVKKLRSVANYAIMPDPIVAMTYLSAGITTHSSITVKNCPLDFLELELCKLEKMGQKFELSKKRKSKNGKFNIVDIKIRPSKLKALPDKIYGRPFPGLNIDNLPLFVPILTQAKGRTLVHDWAYENRSVYFLELQKMGAKVTLLDAHRAIIEGPIDFIPNKLECPPVLRISVVLLICMLAAKGESILKNTYQIERGYENIYENLNKLGADIKVIE